MSEGIPKNIVDRAFIARARAEQDRRASLIPSRKVSDADTDRIEQERARVTSENESFISQRLTQLGIRLTADNKLDMSETQYVRIVGKRARIVKFFDNTNSVLELAYEDTPKRIFRAGVLSENLSADM